MSEQLILTLNIEQLTAQEIASIITVLESRPGSRIVDLGNATVSSGAKGETLDHHFYHEAIGVLRPPRD